MKGNYDKAFENVVRLRVMSILMVNEEYDFNSFKEMLDVTDGNLASHLKNLEKQEYIQVSKSFVGRKPLTNYSATASGKEAFQAHLEFLENLIKENKS
ncbi:transcriptional regulator [Algoriphagus halophytocola]|uniref:Transcriptional regulator n=1 Tax=Algoriphagus halophytocola TaxID=2991499 RepID=A0ABY6MG49_9BACT|nr:MULTISPECIES: transcriptional regulator [unclassified Algoriphagus]UZD22785.1 transcriptional regulator [Algoriphagus sp. TR-M5]WBL44051.1 transcriptional regulator [Algoriphagus sp. TR-M9]